MKKIFVEERGDRKKKLSGFSLLYRFFLNVFRSNKFLFIFCSLMALLISLVNYNVSSNLARIPNLISNESAQDEIKLALDPLVDQQLSIDQIQQLSVKESLDEAKEKVVNLKIKGDNKLFLVNLLDEFIDQCSGEQFDSSVSLTAQNSSDSFDTKVSDGGTEETISYSNLESKRFIYNQIIDKYNGRFNNPSNFRLKFAVNLFFSEFSWQLNLLWFIVSCFLFNVFIKSFLSVIHYFSINYGSELIEKNMKLELFKILLDADYDKSSEVSDKMITQFVSDLDSISRGIWVTSNKLIYSFFSIFFNIRLGFNNWSIGVSSNLILLALIISFSFSIFSLLKKAVALGTEARRRYEYDNRSIVERINKLPHIKANSSEDFEYAKISQILNRTFKLNRNSVIWSVAFKVIPDYLLLPNLSLIFLTIVLLICRNLGNNFTDQQTFLSYLKSLFSKEFSLITAASIGSYYVVVQRIRIEVDKIFQSVLSLEDLSSEVTILNENIDKLSSERGPQPIKDFSIQKQIEFKNIFFSYPSRPDNLIINNLSLSFKAGNFYAIAGKNGIGKSTITKILLKLFPISGGNVLIDGKSIDQFDEKILRRKTCYLTNHPQFIDSTVGQILMYPFEYKEEEHLQKLIEVTKKTRVFDFIETLSDKFNTFIKGGDLSEGQKQQLEATKVFLRDYNLYIFDEILSNVNPITRTEVLAEMFAKLQGKTVIIIDHNYGIFKYVDHDKIVKFENGKFVPFSSNELFSLKANFEETKLK